MDSRRLRHGAASIHIPLTDQGKEVLGWAEIEAEKWYEAPSNAIVIIDECQRVFRPRTISKDPPPHVVELETHRHKGIDLWCMTQHPRLADVALRSLTGRHFHSVRNFGLERSTIHEWAGVKDNCDKSSGRSDSIKLQWKFDKSIYPLYKSAEVHTVKRNIPFKVWLFLSLPVIFIACLWLAYNSTSKKFKNESSGQIEQQSSNPSSNSAFSPNGNSNVSGYKNALEDAKDFVYHGTPRVAGLPYTAPKYDEITKPTTAPVPVACISNDKTCRCFSQQATLIPMSVEMCTEIVAKGFFMDFDDKGGRNVQSKSEPIAARDTRAVPVNASLAPAASDAVFAGTGQLQVAEAPVQNIDSPQVVRGAQNQRAKR